MADQAALFGLAGAVGGAVLGAGATLAVPFLTHRNTQREQRRSRLEEEHHRLMELRRTSRELLLVLDDARQVVLRGEQVEKARLCELFDGALKETRDAADRCSIHGLNFVHTSSSPGGDGGRTTPEARNLRNLIQHAKVMAKVITNDSNRTGIAARADGRHR